METEMNTEIISANEESATICVENIFDNKKFNKKSVTIE